MVGRLVEPEGRITNRTGEAVAGEALETGLLRGAVVACGAPDRRPADAARTRPQAPWLGSPFAQVNGVEDGDETRRLVLARVRLLRGTAGSHSSRLPVPVGGTAAGRVGK